MLFPLRLRLKELTQHERNITVCNYVGHWLSHCCAAQEAVNFVLLMCYDKTLKTRINKNVNIAKKLAEYALKKGSSDNVTVIIYFFD